MRTNWIITSGNIISMYDIQSLAEAFYIQHGCVADSIAIPHREYSQFLTSMHQGVAVLERGKDYGLFLAIPGGMVELVLMDAAEESTANNQVNTTIMYATCNKVDREFEKHVLKSDS